MDSAGDHERVGVQLLAWATVGALVAGCTAGLVYEQLIVPRLPSLRSVPWRWWAGMIAPVMVVGFVLGLVVRHASSFAAAWFVATVATVAGYLAGSGGRVRAHDMDAAAALASWSLLTAAAYLVLLVSGQVVYRVSGATRRSRRHEL